jgi:hypothetical protein
VTRRRGDDASAPFHYARRIDVVRWILVIPSAIAAWYLAFILTVIVGAIVVGACIDSDYPQPGYCEASWVQFALAHRLPIRFGIWLSAVLVVIVSAIVAPNHRVAVAWAALGAGAIVAGVMGERGGRRRRSRSCSRIRSIGRSVRISVSAQISDATVARTNVMPNA